MEKNLSLLQSNHSGVMVVRDGTYANYKVIRLEGDRFVHYTGRGLREMFTSETEDIAKKAMKLLALDERNLILSNHIAVTLFSEIERIVT
jgi:hypothetical protein